MQQTRTAPPKKASVETLRNDAIDFLVVQIARPRREIRDGELKGSVLGPLSNASEVSLRSFLKRPEGSYFDLVFKSMRKLEKFDKMLEESGLFENIDCAWEKMKDGTVEVRVTLDLKKLSRAEAEGLLTGKEKQLLAVARAEEKKKGAADDLRGLMDSDDPMGAGIPENEELTAIVASPLEVPEKKEEAGFRGWYLSSTSGNKVPIFSSNWEKNEEERKRLWKNLIEMGQCTFKVNNRILRKFEDERFREQFIELARSKEAPDLKILIDGNKITITRGINERDTVKRAWGKG